MLVRLFLFLYILRKLFVSISGEPDQAPRSATPDLSLHCLHGLHNGRLIFFIAHINIHILLQTSMYHSMRNRDFCQNLHQMPFIFISQ